MNLLNTEHGIWLYLGSIAVGIFFFLSAYGIVVQFQKRGMSYLKKLLFVNLPKIYFWFVLTNLIYFLCFHLNLINSSNATMYVLKIFGLIWAERLNAYSWFMFTIMVLYLAFIVIYFVCSFFKNKHIAPIAVAFAPIIFAIIIVTAAPSFLVYSSCVCCFSFGILYANYKSAFDQFFQKHFKALALLCFVVIVFCMFFKNLSWIISFFVCILYVLLSTKILISNKILMFLGKISLQIYLLQYLFFVAYNKIVQNSYAFSLLVCISTLLSATALYYIVYFVKNLLSRAKSHLNA